MNKARRKPSLLRALDTQQKAEVFQRLLKRRPLIREELEQIAAQVLANVDVEKIAQEVATAVVTIDADPGGPDEFGGYHEPGENVSDDLEEAIERFTNDMKKRLKLGHTDEARRICMGVVLGLFRASQVHGNMGGLDDYPEWPVEAAEEAIEVYRGHRSRPRPPEPPPFPESFWRKMHGGWSDTLAW